ncbi:MAG: GSCFA domain-containing protein, partial [Opitutales bacterium]|nr:GSCFA domain-containing protein [Opitutales bacterium]
MHSSKTNPYSKKLAKHFWRTAIADLESVEIGELWNPKFKITLSSKILTVGSCFAKHISNWLKVQGFGFIDSEPAPAHLSKTNRENQGYGIFSFRVGNVYSAAMLKQWVFWALGLKKCPRV